MQMAYTAQQRLDGYSEAVEHATRRKRWFDNRVLKSKAGLVEFKASDLVQFFHNELNNTLKTEKKLAPMWSAPHRVVKRIVNSYPLETLDGQQLEGAYSARRLRRFTPREGMMLAEEQKRREEEDATETNRNLTVTALKETRETEHNEGEMEVEGEAALHPQMGAESDIESDDYSAAEDTVNTSIASRIRSR